MKAAGVITGRMVLIGALAFFGVIFAANGVLVFFALQSWPGLATDKAYEEGIAYNRTLAAARAQAARGWRSAVVFAGARSAGDVSLRITAEGNVPLGDVQARILFQRPLREGFDVDVSLRRRGPGYFTAPVSLPLDGRWYAVVTAARDGQILYRMRHELMVKP